MPSRRCTIALAVTGALLLANLVSGGNPDSGARKQEDNARILRTPFIADQPHTLIDGDLAREAMFLSFIQQVSCDGTAAGIPSCEGANQADDFVSWSNTEVQFQYGELNAPSFAGAQSSATRILTLQHASGWRFGDNFFFVDLLDDSLLDGFNDRDVYMEGYANFSLGKILDRKVGLGFVSDVGLIAGINYAADPNVRKWLPGMRLSWDFPGFAFFNTDITAFLDDSGGVMGGGAPLESDSFMIDFNWALPFSLGVHDFSVEGHIEFIGGRMNEFGDDVSWWILGQPQFRYDAGKALFGKSQKLFIGIEWQFWPNKLGDRFTDENEVQALAVWRL